jgi:hypothetical protein
LDPKVIENDTDVDEAWLSSDFEAEGPKIQIRRSDGIVEYFLTAVKDDGEIMYAVAADLVLTGSAGFADGRVGIEGERSLADVTGLQERCNGAACETRGEISIPMTAEQFEAGKDSGHLVTFYGNKTVSFHVGHNYFIGFGRAVDDAD